jgi:hypothetical protein
MVPSYNCNGLERLRATVCAGKEAYAKHLNSPAKKMTNRFNV